MSRLDTFTARPYIVIQNDVGDFLAPGGVWTRARAIRDRLVVK